MRRSASERYTFQERLAGSLDVRPPKKAPAPFVLGSKLRRGGAVNRQGSICSLAGFENEVIRPLYQNDAWHVRSFVRMQVRFAVAPSSSALMPVQLPRGTFQPVRELS